MYSQVFDSLLSRGGVGNYYHARIWKPAELSGRSVAENYERRFASVSNYV